MLTHNIKDWVELIEPIVAALSDLVWGPPYPLLILLIGTHVFLWSLPDEEKPFFMQVIMPMQQEDWIKLKGIAEQWIAFDSKHSDAWYFLGLAELKMKNYAQAVEDLKQAYDLNKRHLDSLLELFNIAKAQDNQAELDWALKRMKEVDPDFVKYNLNIT